ncbi:hypothetical protein SKAU_G00317270 [Synaphobranchus kaupii]|uniref:Uncharacterized protein n=1 Tax=Synaphobranchus kaupii TaxID=118154 RepID=A0A9Q1ILN2_SYNKA|nr:hypothetical protein SKAU_G00317270 [Synaphobranchus kaupii]
MAERQKPSPRKTHSSSVKWGKSSTANGFRSEAFQSVSWVYERGVHSPTASAEVASKQFVQRPGAPDGDGGDASPRNGRPVVPLTFARGDRALVPPQTVNPNAGHGDYVQRALKARRCTPCGN